MTLRIHHLAWLGFRGALAMLGLWKPTLALPSSFGLFGLIALFAPAKTKSLGSWMKRP